MPFTLLPQIISPQSLLAGTIVGVADDRTARRKKKGKGEHASSRQSKIKR